MCGLSSRKPPPPPPPAPRLQPPTPPNNAQALRARNVELGGISPSQGGTLLTGSDGVTPGMPRTQRAGRTLLG